MEELLLPCAAKACTYFCGESDRNLDIIQVRSAEGSPSLVMEASNGHTAIQITTNNPEFEPDEFTVAFEINEIKKWLKTGVEPEGTEDRLPDIDAAVASARNSFDTGFSESLMQLRFWTETNMALRAVFKENVNVSLTAHEEITLPLSVFAEGESRDKALAVVEIFIMRLRE